MGGVACNGWRFWSLRGAVKPAREPKAKIEKTPKAQKLNELPDADVYRAVYRRIGKCEAPIIVKFGVTGR